MYILEEHNLAFIAHPKTASSATKRVLRGLGAKLYGTHHEVKEDHCQRLLDAGGIIMSTVRNPFDLFVSWYFHYAARRGEGNEIEPFKEWLPFIMENPNPYMKRGLFYGLKWSNRVLAFESLQWDFGVVLEECDIETQTIEPFNISHKRKARPYQWLYDAELIQLLLDRYGDQMLDYKFEEISDAAPE